MFLLLLIAIDGEDVQQLINEICLVYLNNVIIFSEDFEGMMKRLEQVFYRLRSANLKLNPKKCSFSEKGN